MPSYVCILPCCYDMSVVHWSATKHKLWPRAEYLLDDNSCFPLLVVAEQTQWYLCRWTKDEQRWLTVDLVPTCLNLEGGDAR